MNVEDKKIILLNKNITKNERKIKNLKIRDDIIGFFPVVVLTGTVVGVGIKFNNSQFISDNYFGMILISLFAGCIHGNFLSHLQYCLNTYSHNTTTLLLNFINIIDIYLMYLSIV